MLDPDLWNDDGTPKRPSKQYMDSLEVMQTLEAVDPTLPARRAEEQHQAFLSYVAAKRELREHQAPAVGDVVHFWDDEKARCRAAMVMEIEGHVATLRVHIPHEAFQDWEADHDEDRRANTWHWAED